MADASQESSGRPLKVRLWVPATGILRDIAGQLAARVAEFLGTTGKDAQSLGERVEGVASQLGSESGHESISFEFRQVEGELIIEAHCSGESSEVRHRLSN